MAASEAAKRRIMEVLNKKEHALPTLEIGAIVGLTVSELEEAVKELEQEGLVKTKGGPRLYNQIVFLRKTFNASFGELAIPILILLVLALLIFCGITRDRIQHEHSDKGQGEPYPK